jgi:hypothetical protein
MTPEIDRVLNEYRLLETGYRAKQPPNTILNGTRDIIPRKIFEAEKDNYDLCKLGPGEVAYKDISRVEAVARKSSRFFTREVFEKNILPEQTKEAEDAPKHVSDYDLWKNKKEFLIRIRQDMLN